MTDTKTPNVGDWTTYDYDDNPAGTTGVESTAATLTTFPALIVAVTEESVTAYVFTVNSGVQLVSGITP